MNSKDIEIIKVFLSQDKKIQAVKYLRNKKYGSMKECLILVDMVQEETEKKKK